MLWLLGWQQAVSSYSLIEMWQFCGVSLPLLVFLSHRCVAQRWHGQPIISQVINQSYFKRSTNIHQAIHQWYLRYSANHISDNQPIIFQVIDHSILWYQWASYLLATWRFVANFYWRFQRRGIIASRLVGWFALGVSRSSYVVFHLL